MTSLNPSFHIPNHSFLSIWFQINFMQHRLQRLHDVWDKLNPDKEPPFPVPEAITINKLGEGGLVITDTCNPAQKLRRILVEIVDGSYDYDCMNHLRNVWLGGMERAITAHLNELLRLSLDEIDPRLRVTASVTAIIRAVDKEFSLSANYPKGHGEMFLEWVQENHPGKLLMHVERASGSRQDLCTGGSMAILMNYPLYLQFIDEELHKLNARRETSILQRNLWFVLTSDEMIALVRLLSIIHLSMTMPLRWLAGKTHELRKYQWGPVSMGRAIDTLELKMEELSRNPKKIVDENFMMNMFAEYRDELPPFQEYWDVIYKKKQMTVVARKSGTKVVHLARLRKQLFKPILQTEKDTTKRMIELAKIAADAILAELRDERKATFKYRSRSGSPYSWRHSSDERKKALLGKKATNDEAESALGGTTSQIQMFGRINIANAAAISDMKRNSFLHRSSKAKHDTKPRGMFHQFSSELQRAIVTVAMQDANKTKERNNEQLRIIAAAKRRKEEVEKQKAYDKATNQYIKAQMLIDMYHSGSGACVKGDPKLVTSELKKLGSDTARMKFLKTNIDIRAKGFSWEWAETAWTEDGEKKTVKELTKRLRWIIAEETKKGYEIPLEPKVHLPQRKESGTLGTQIDFVRTLDEKYIAKESEFRKNAEVIRQSRGESNLYARLQPFYRPNIEDLLNRRIDVQYICDVNGEPVKKWCQGEVIEVYENRRKPIVRVLWDATPDIAGFEEENESDQELMPGKWNKDCEFAWRMDIDIAVGGEDSCDNVESDVESDASDDDN